MWSLPDTKRLNSEAQVDRKRLEQKRLEQAVLTGVLDGKTLCCEYGKNCAGQLSHQLWYDVFSADPKGILTQCELHWGRCGIPEGFFWCCACRRLMVKNYTWEAYSTDSKDPEKVCLVCLRCAAERYIKDENNWIALTDEDIAVITFDVARRKACHVLAAGMPVPEQIQRFDSVTLDSSTDGMIRRFNCADSTPSTPKAAVERVREILDRAKDAGHGGALLICDGAYQFAVSVGVYVPSSLLAECDPSTRAGM